MSLVHQALRKAEQEKSRKTVGPPIETPERVLPAASPPGSAVAAATAGPASVPVQAPAPVRPTGSRRSPLFWFALVGLLGLTIALAVMMIPGQPSSSREAPPAAVASSTPPTAELPTASTPVANAPVADQASTPAPVAATDDARFKLSGIAQLPDGERAAVINGQLRSVDQYIDGAIIKQIDHDRVTLDVDGREVVKRLF